MIYFYQNFTFLKKISAAPPLRGDAAVEFSLNISCFHYSFHFFTNNFMLSPIISCFYHAFHAFSILFLFWSFISCFLYTFLVLIIHFLLSLFFSCFDHSFLAFYNLFLFLPCFSINIHIFKPISLFLNQSLLLFIISFCFSFYILPFHFIF